MDGYTVPSRGQRDVGVLRVIRLQLAFFLVFAASLAMVAEGQELPTRVDFRSEVLPILASKCFECHGPNEESRQGELRLDVSAGVGVKLSGNGVVVVPGDIQRSELFQRIITEDGEK